MIDVAYYSKYLSLDSQSSENLIKKFFQNFNFDNLFKFKLFLQELPNNANLLDKIRENNKPLSQDRRNLLLNQANQLSHIVNSMQINPSDFLNDTVFPNVNIDSLLYDLNPKKSGNAHLVDCPCCNDKKTKAYIVLSGGQNTGTIACNRLNECGEKTSVFKHIQDREHLSYIDTVKYLANQVGIDYDVYIRNREMHKEDNGVFQDKNYNCDIKELEKKDTQIKVKDIYTVGELGELQQADYEKSFKNVDLTRLLMNYKSYDDTDRLRLVYSYIKKFTLQEEDKSKMYEYLASRGIPQKNTANFGFLKANKINSLVAELKEIFGEEDLIKFNILSNKGRWKYSLLTKDEKYIYNDSVVFFANDIYNSSPTNIEFKFFGENVVGSPRKSISMSNSELLNSNYFSNITIDILKKDSNIPIWWCEGALDVKCIESMGGYANGLIGAGKHFNYNLGLYKDKVQIIALDEDEAGRKNSLILAKKLLKIGVKNIYFASWSEEYGNDLNDLLRNRNLDKIILTKVLTSINKDTGEIQISNSIDDKALLPQKLIQNAYKNLDLANDELKKKSDINKQAFIQKKSFSSDNHIQNSINI